MHFWRQRSKPTTMPQWRWLFGTLLAASVLVSTGCVKSTPVTPAPLAAEEQQRVAATLLGAWRATHSKQGDAAKEEEGATVEFEFRPDGKYRHVIVASIAAVDNTYGYRLDGGNVVTDSPHGTYRINFVDGQRLELFNYDATTTWYLVRKGP